MRPEDSANLEKCLKCTACNDFCPMMAVNPDYPGPKQCGPDGARYRIKSGDYYNKLLKYCLSCRRCEVACPSGVRIGDLIQKARLENGSSDHPLRDFFLSNTDLVGKVATRMPETTNTLFRSDTLKDILDNYFSVDSHRSFPAYSDGTFEKWFKENAEEEQSTFGRHVAYFHGCYVNYNNPSLGRGLVTLLNAAGYGVHLLDGERCCGVALMANGRKKQALRHAKANVTAIRKAAATGMPVLTTGSTCTFTIRDEYSNVLEIDCADVRDSVTMAVKWLYERVSSGDIKLVFRKGLLPRRIAYHTPCHLQKLGWAIYSTELLKMVPGVELTVLEQKCCGISGTFGFKKEYYRFSQEIGQSLFDDIRAVRPMLVATDCETCKWQIEMATGFSVENPISVIAASLDIEATRKANNI